MTKQAKSSIGDFSIPRAWSCDWWEPNELLTAVEIHRRRFRFFEDMYRPELQPLREAWAASKFAKIRSQHRPIFIKLGSDRFPDFFIRENQEINCFELTEAYHEGRRRNDEYRLAAKHKLEGKPSEVELCDVGEEEDTALRSIFGAIKKKAEKNYSDPPHLLVYVSCSWASKSSPVKNNFVSELHQWSGTFKSCWLLWERVFRLWPPPPAMIRPPETGDLSTDPE